MQALQIVVFLASAVTLPIIMFIVARARMSFLCRLVLFAVLLLVARYLLGSVWVPDGIWPLRIKTFFAGFAGFGCWRMVNLALRAHKARAWIVFVSYMLFPFIVCFAFFPSTLAIGGLYAGDRAWWSLGFESVLGNMAFWIFWVVVSWINASCWTSSKMAQTLLFLVSAIAIVFFASATLRQYMVAVGKDIVTVIRENVAKRWPSINEKTAKISAAWEKVVELDRKIVAEGKIGTRKLKAVTNIESDIRKLRRDLLPLNSQIVLSDVNKLEEKIESSRKTLSALRERRLLVIGNAESLDSEIAEEATKLENLEHERSEAIAKARSDLKAIGLELPEGSVFLTVDLGDIVDNAIVAKNIGMVVENLKCLMDDAKGDATAAKRYYGAYVVMLDVQSECFRQYLEKAKSGIWRDGVRAIALDAEAAKRNNEAKAAAEGATDFEKRAFLHSAGINDKTLTAARAYMAILEKHSEIVQEKLAAAERMHEVALSFWESADIASAFGARISSDIAEFQALLELKLPEIAFLDDVAIQEEFDAITQKLKKE